MPEFIIHSEAGDGAFLARRLLTEGHKVRLYVKDPKGKNLYRGLAPITKVFNPTQREIVLFDMVKYGSHADSLRKRGYKVIGASRFADSLEIDRSYGSRVMRDVGIKIPQTFTFTNLNDGIRFLDVQDGVWYFKPCGIQTTASTYNGEAKDLKRYLEWVKKEPPESFELQRKMEGTEISLEGWWDGSKWIYPFNSTVEDKKLMTGDIGPRTGCMANVVWAYDEPRPTLASKTLMRLAPLLERSGYVGPVDLNMVIDKEGSPYGLEWSPRFGYDALYALAQITEGDLGHQFAEFVEGKLDKFDVRTDAYSLTLNVSIPPYPNGYGEENAGLPIDEKVLRDSRIFPRDVMVGTDGKPAVSGCDGSICVIGAVGTDLDLLRKETVDLARELVIPNAQYRIDPVKRTESVLTALSSFMYDIPDIKEGEVMRKSYTQMDEKREERIRKKGEEDKARRIEFRNQMRNISNMPTITNVDTPTFNK